MLVFTVFPSQGKGTRNGFVDPYPGRAHRFEVENSSFNQNHHGFPGSIRSSSEVDPTFQTRLVMLRVHRTS